MTVNELSLGARIIDDDGTIFTKIAQPSICEIISCYLPSGVIASIFQKMKHLHGNVVWARDFKQCRRNLTLQDDDIWFFD